METLEKHQVRWLIRRDLPAVLDIEQGRPDPWDEERFLTHLKQRNCIGLVAEDPYDGTIDGFIVYEFHKEKLQVSRLRATCPGALNHLVEKLASKLSQQHYPVAELLVPERDLQTQIRLREMGVWCYGYVYPNDHSQLRFLVEMPEVAVAEGLGV